MLEKAMRLCGAAFGYLDTYDGESFHRAAELGVPAAFAEFRRQNPPDYGPGTIPECLLRGEQVVHAIDIMDSDIYRPGSQTAVPRLTSVEHAPALLLLS